MARDHARLKVKLWDKSDWRTLSVQAQHMYLLLVSSKHLTYCGVMDWWPNRIAMLASDMDEAYVYAAVKELVDGRYVYLDGQSCELLVRTYVRHDNILQRLNMGKACAKAFGDIDSLDLKELLLEELAKLRRDEPLLAGWEGIKTQDIEMYELVISMGRAMQSESNQ